MDQSNFNALNLVPRHISKYVHRRKLSEQYAQERDALLRLDLLNGQFGTVGSETDHSAYPQAYARELRRSLAVFQSLDLERVFVSNGSDEALDLLLRGFCMPGKDHALTFVPCAERFQRLCGANGVHLHELNLTADFQLPIYKAKTSLTEQTKVVLIANPNPINGTPIRNFDIVDILDAFEGLVVLDESLIEFSAEGSMLEHLHQYPNLVIVQSFSHAWGMAGLRLGAVYAHPSVIEVLDALASPYAVNAVAQSVALRAIECAHERASIITDTVNERERLREALLRFKFIDEVEYSQANCLMVKTAAPELLVKYLREERIAALDVSGLPACAGGVRLTVGKREQNDRLLHALSEMAVKLSPMRRFLRAVNKGLRQAGVFLGFFKKLFGAGG